MSKKRKKGVAQGLSKFPQSLDIELELSLHDDKDYLGGALPKEIINEKGDWLNDLVLKEYQNLNGVEPFACVSYTILNAIEMVIKKKYGVERNYSDRFLAKVSGTTNRGNAPKSVCQAVRDFGLILQGKYQNDAKSFNDYYKELPPEFREIAKEFNKEFDFRYERVSYSEASEYLMYSPLLVSVPAWSERNGRYYRSHGMRDNHATTLISKNFVFDSYEPAIKEIDFIPTIAYRFHVEKKVKRGIIKIPFWEKFLRGFRGICLNYNHR